MENSENFFFLSLFYIFSQFAASDKKREKINARTFCCPSVNLICRLEQYQTIKYRRWRESIIYTDNLIKEKWTWLQKKSCVDETCRKKNEVVLREKNKSLIELMDSINRYSVCVKRGEKLSDEEKKVLIKKKIQLFSSL